MLLEHLVLDNVRALESCEISFVAEDGSARGRTLLLGGNGSGRTTILQSIALLLAGPNALAELIPHPDFWIRNGRKSCSMIATIVDGEGKRHTVEIGIKRGDDTWKVIERNTDSIAALEKLDRVGYPIAGYGISRRQSSGDGSSSSESFERPYSRSVATLFSADATLHPLEQWALATDASSKSGAAVVRRMIGDLLPGAPLHAIDRRNRHLTFKTADGILPLGRLSDGYRSVAAWIGDLLYRISERAGDSRAPWNARGLLLVDELELHMDPLWERLFLIDLTERFPHLQLIATTNSPLIAHQARSGEIFHLTRDGAGSAPSLRRYDGDPSRLMIHQLLASPLFGLDTVDSAPVEQLRIEHRRLKSRPARELSGSERRRAKELEEEIRDLPRWNSGAPGEDEKRSLLENIERAIAKR